MTDPSSNIYEFGEFKVHAGKRLLIGRDDKAIPLTPKVFDTLLYLVEHSGSVLCKDELMKAIWPDTFVEENNLNQTISALRRVFGENRGENRYIATVPGRGYRFVAVVRKTEVTDFSDPGIDVAFLSERLTTRDRRRVLLIIAAVVVMGGTLATYYLQRTRTDVAPSPKVSVSNSSGPPIKSIAVLPFKSLVADEKDESLELGMADTLIVRLSSLKEVVVMPIGSVRRFSGLEQDPIAAGRHLGVESVLDGQIQRSGKRIRVTARLVRVADGSQLWADQYDHGFTDIFTLQDLISEEVTSALALKLTGDEQRRLTKHHTESSEAYQLYINGRYYWGNRTEEGLKRAVEYFKEALAKDPNYALAHAGLADAYALLGVFHLPPNETFPHARSAAMDALRIDDQLAEAHAALGHVKVQYDYDWAGAQKEYQQALELNPNYANAHHFYALYLTMRGRFDEAIAEINRAQELEPSSLFIHANAAVILYQARRYDEAITQAKRVLEINPSIDLARNVLGRAYIQKIMLDQAISELQKISTPPFSYSGDLGQAYALAGRKSEALTEIDRLQRLSQKHYVAPYDLMLVYSGLSDVDKTLEWLERASADRSTRMVWAKVEPQLDRFRSQARFQAVIKRMGLE